MTDSITVSPAYGRDYKSRAAALADWNAGKDFKIETLHPVGGTYVNRADILRENKETSVWIRYDGKTKICKATT